MGARAACKPLTVAPFFKSKQLSADIFHRAQTLQRT